MPWIILGFAIALVGLLLCRSVWMRVQARRAIHRWLAQRGRALSSAQAIAIFEDMGGILRAATALRLPYAVVARNAEGREESILLVADFVPLVGLFRRIEQLTDQSRVDIQVAEPGATPNGGPATQPGNSSVTEGPPSVS